MEGELKISFENAQTLKRALTLLSELIPKPKNPKSKTPQKPLLWNWDEQFSRLWVRISDTKEKDIQSTLTIEVSLSYAKEGTYKVSRSGVVPTPMRVGLHTGNLMKLIVGKDALDLRIPLHDNPSVSNLMFRSSNDDTNGCTFRTFDVSTLNSAPEIKVDRGKPKFVAVLSAKKFSEVCNHILRPKKGEPTKPSLVVRFDFRYVQDEKENVILRFLMQGLDINGTVNAEHTIAIESFFKVKQSAITGKQVIVEERLELRPPVHSRTVYFNASHMIALSEAYNLADRLSMFLDDTGPSCFLFEGDVEVTYYLTPLIPTMEQEDE